MPTERLAGSQVVILLINTCDRYTKWTVPAVSQVRKVSSRACAVAIETNAGFSVGTVYICFLTANCCLWPAG